MGRYSSEEFFESLKRRHGYHAWRERNTLGEDLFVWRFFLSGHELSGWEAARVRVIEPEPPPEAEPGVRASLGPLAGQWPRVVTAIWRRADHHPDVLVQVDAFECASQAAAHEFLVRALGEFQSPDITRQETGGPGDVAFTGERAAVVLFARANLVLFARSCGRELVEVAGVVRDLDAHVIRKPAVRPGTSQPEVMRRFEASAAPHAVGVDVPLDLEITDALGRPLMYKFFWRQGQMHLTGGRPTYRSRAVGLQSIDVYALSPEGGVAHGALRLTAS
jgi:hypothetical protein